jgi:hypothetical protein
MSLLSARPELDGPRLPGLPRGDAVSGLHCAGALRNKVRVGCGTDRDRKHYPG